MIILILSSCGKQIVSITNNSYADSQAIPQGFLDGCSFFIMPAKNDNQLLSKEVSQKIATIMVNKGYVIDTEKNATYYLTFNFDMQSSTQTINVPRYIPGQTQTTQGNIYGYRGGYAGYQEQTQTSGSVVYVQREYTFFNKTLIIRIYNAKVYRETKTEDLIWEGSASSCGENSDLRLFMDFLLLSVFRYFGKNTQQYVQSKLSPKDKDVQWLRNTYSQPSDLAKPQKTKQKKRSWWR